MGTIYISGPMSNLKNFNFLNFFRAERDLRKLGWRVINPARMSFEYLYQLQIKENNPDLNFTDVDMDEFARQDCEAVIQANAVYMLKDWEFSNGAFGEWSLARWLKRKIYYQNKI